MLKFKLSNLFICIVSTFVLIYVLFSSPALAAKLQVSIPGAGDNLNLPQYIEAIYNYSLSIVGILATVVIMFGGLLWVMAGGNASKIDNAKSWVTAGVTGFVLLMMSYTLLYMINPNLVSFRSITPAKPEQTGCCEPSGTDGQAYDTVASKCKGSFMLNQKEKNGECMQYDSDLGCCIKTVTDGKRTCNEVYSSDCPKSSSPISTQIFFPKRCAYYDECVKDEIEKIPDKYGACCVKTSICHPFNTSNTGCSSNYCRGGLSGEYVPTSCIYIDKCKKIGGTCG